MPPYGTAAFVFPQHRIYYFCFEKDRSRFKVQRSGFKVKHTLADKRFFVCDRVRDIAHTYQRMSESELWIERYSIPPRVLKIMQA
jgi:hypothetical protein